VGLPPKPGPGGGRFQFGVGKRGAGVPGGNRFWTFFSGGGGPAGGAQAGEGADFHSVCFLGSFFPNPGIRGMLGIFCGWGAG